MGDVKTIAYVDGNNIYHGIIDSRNTPSKGHTPFTKDRPWGDLLWLNLESFIKSYNLPHIDLIKIKIFQAPSYKPDSLKRQQEYFNALMSLNTFDEFSLFFGEFKPFNYHCNDCGVTHVHHIEKKTDAAMSTEILSDFFLRNCDATVIIGGDSDQIPVLEKLKLLDNNRLIYAIFPPFRTSKEIVKLLGKENCRSIRYERLLAHQLAETVTVKGFQFHKPKEYRRIP